MLRIEKLNVSFQDKQLLSDINITIPHGAHILLSGHNGAGKSTLANIIAGNPAYTITSGQIIFNDKNITNENATTRALMGIFLGAQHVPEIPGLSVLSFLKHSAIAHKHFQTGHDLSMAEFLDNLKHAQEQLNIPQEWLNRSMNVGFSGGERKRLMLLQLMLTKPKLAILDEPDSGADITTQELIAQTIHNTPDTTFIFISHQSAFTDLIAPTHTITLSGGEIMVK